MKYTLLILAFLLGTSYNAMTTTWFPAKKQCPLCKTQSEYQVIGSYGSYIYHWPSKYQYVYWPLTDGPSVYCCPHCYFSAYMWDFDSIPDNKKDTIKAAIQHIKPQRKYKSYLDIPITKRLELAEKVYQFLDRDTEFWCRFYRVMGYHYEIDKQPDNALASRIKALNLAKMMVVDSAYAGQKKENLFIMAAMQNYIGHKDSALLYLREAAEHTYTNKDWKTENEKGLDEYLTDLIEQYALLIKKENETEFLQEVK